MSGKTAQGMGAAAEAAAALDVDTSSMSPLQRSLTVLADSRQRLRVALIPPKPDLAVGGEGPLTRRAKALWAELQQRLQNAPALDVVLQAVQAWWQRHPLRDIGAAVGSEVRGTAVPIVRRHPWATVVGAVVLGLVIGKLRPWRWSLVARQIAPLRKRALNWVFAQAVSAPIQTIASGWLAMMALNRKGTKSAPAAPMASTPLRTDPAAPAATAAENANYP